MIAAEIRTALRRHYTAPEHAICFEVAAGTGHMANRHLDAVVMDLWPSRGLFLTGIEIKISRNDWRREKKNPAKAEEVARFLDYFVIAAPIDIVPIDELPAAWGLIEFRDDGKPKVKRLPVKTDALPVSRSFMAAIMRACNRPMSADDVATSLSEQRKALEEGFSERVRIESERLTKKIADSQDHWDSLVKALGLDPERFYDDTSLIAAVKAVYASGVATTWAGLSALEKTLADAHAKVAEAVGVLHVEKNVLFRRKAK